MAKKRVETMPCANCETPVAPGDLVCPGCGARFAYDQEAEEQSAAVRIAEYRSELEAGMAQGILADAGMDSFLADAPDNATSWFWRGWNKSLLVRVDRAESALALLADWQETPAIADAESAPAEDAPVTVKGYSGTMMKIVLVLGLGLMLLSMWRMVLIVYILLGAAYVSRRWL